MAKSVRPQRPLRCPVMGRIVPPQTCPLREQFNRERGNLCWESGLTRNFLSRSPLMTQSDNSPDLFALAPLKASTALSLGVRIRYGFFGRIRWKGRGGISHASRSTTNYGLPRPPWSPRRNFAMKKLYTGIGKTTEKSNEGAGRSTKPTERGREGAERVSEGAGRHPRKHVSLASEGAGR